MINLALCSLQRQNNWAREGGKQALSGLQIGSGEARGKNERSWEPRKKNSNIPWAGKENLAFITRHSESREKMKEVP